MKIKKILYLLLILVLIQTTRFLFKSCIFLIIKRTLINDIIVSSISILLGTLVLIYIAKVKKINLNIFPKKFNLKYKILTTLFICFIIITLIITKNYSLFNILSLIYNGILTVIFEELLFRGYIYKKISDFKTEKESYIISTILFGIWHLGYIDTVIYRLSYFASNGNLFNIMTAKVVTGFILGIFFGYLRYKNKNVYSSMMLHSFINIFGS